ncbi:MAG TPA: outer membrane protein assembly factor BamD, partial [Vicinamibacterales bacterium]|nr:outer membrane protein assembly factor BamD [Vicinamibacterales bacterium]
LTVVGLGILALVLATTTPADAANKEHQQLMADLRMLQEQSQVLQNLIGQVAEAVKATNGRIDQQTETNRKSLADQKLIIDNLSNDVRVVREKLDDNNVRIGTLTQEVNALRQALQQGSRPAATTDSGAPPSPNTGGAAPNIESPTAIWDAAYADYTVAQYDLAIQGFTSYIKSFPKSDKADDAQVYICRAYVQDAKYDKAIEACDVAIRTYPNGHVIPEAYFYKGLAYSNLKNLNAARDAWEELLRKYPGTTAADQAKTRLDNLRRPN